MGSLGEVYLFRISAEHFMVLLSTAKESEIQKTGTGASEVLRKVTALKILKYACVKDKLSKGVF